MDLVGLSALLTSSGWALLESLPPYDEHGAIALGERLRTEGHDPALVAAALTQTRLRAKARDKFGPFADGMLLTPDGLEQATRLDVAARHAQRYVAAGLERVVDLGCGIGGDAMAFAALEREVTAVDADELTTAVATVNLRHWEGTSVRCADVTTLDLAEVGVGTPSTGVWLDPARRSGVRSASGAARRTHDPESYNPPWSFVTQVAATAAGCGAKLSPGFPTKRLPTDAEAQWVSVEGDAVELALWWGALARTDVRRSALVIGRDSAAELTGDPGAPPVGAPGAWLYEPDPAVVQAGLVHLVADAVDGRAMQSGVPYLTADRLVATPFARAWAIEDVLPYNVKALRSYLRDRGVGRLTVKKRGVSVEPEALRRQMRLAGDAEATIAVTRVAGQQTVLVLRHR